MKHQRLLLAGLLLGGVTLTGCMKDKEPTKPTVTKPAPAKVMTHYMSSDQPCYMKMGGETCGTLKKGTKLLVLIPGSMAQVETEDGKTLWTKIDGVEPIEVPAPPKPPMPPATKPAAPKPVAVAPAAPAKTMTHWLTADQPYYTAIPTPGAKPAGTLSQGTKVLLLIPGTWSQIETADGKTVYTKIDGVDTIPAK